MWYIKSKNCVSFNNIVQESRVKLLFTFERENNSINF